jgi:PAS domain S-box-containing protein
MSQTSLAPNFSTYRTVGEAAAYLGVSTATLRNWDRSGKLTPRRHPQNGYRIYLHEDLEAVLRSADLSNLTDASSAPLVDWSKVSEREHFVQFYESDTFLVDSVSEFMAAGLRVGDGSLILATAEHREAIHRKLAACGVELAAAIAEGRCIMLDAAEMLAKFMIDGSPDARWFADTVGDVVAQVAESGRRVRAFGEMVALLWAGGNRDAAIRVEELWNELGKSHRFALMCGYPMSGFSLADDDAPLGGVCACHTRVVPAESYAAISDPDQRLRAITLLQQKALSLEAEIAHREQVETALETRERELTDFFENATEGMHKVGPDGTILWANKAEYGLLGYTAEEYVGRSITEFHADAAVIAEMLEKLRNGEMLENFPARLRCKDGSIKHVLVNSSACFERGEFAYTRCFSRDVTERWQAEQARREADRRKDEFLAMLAHEFRNPLAPMSNALELVRGGCGNEKEADDAIRVLDRQMRQMRRLVDDLLDVSRITLGRIQIVKERVDLAAAVRSAIETSRPAIETAGHKLTVTLPMRPIIVNADSARLDQVFSNLLTNSAKYTEPGGRISIEAEQRGEEAIVTVRDNGIGIACDALAYVFDMFRQVDGSLERSQGGLGIGLTLVRRLVESHGGSVEARSEGPGKGSEFVVRLPIAGETDRATVPRRSVEVAVSKRRVLVVDDNEDSGDTLSMLLRIKGHEVRTARDGLQAIELVPEFLPEVILMDVGMPRLNGYEATRRIRQMPSGEAIFIVAVTGWGQPDDKQRSAEAGCSGHMTKPVDFATLEKLLAEMGGPRSA